MKIFKTICVLLVLVDVSLAQAPASVTGDHVHSKGSWMFGYRYMFMDMSGHKMPHMHKAHAGHDHEDGSDHSDDNGHSHDGAQSDSGDHGHGGMMQDDHHEGDHQEHGNYGDGDPHSKSHEHTMTMQMHMLEAMYGVTDDLSLMVMTHFLQNTMDHGAGFKTRNEGLGDTSLTALYRLYGDCHKESLIGGLGISFPTGDVTNSDNYHTGKSHHPYHMALGSGTFDLLPSLTYSQSNESFFWGFQGTGAIRLDNNTAGYKFGDKYVAQTWVGAPIAKAVSVTARLAGTFQGDVRGRDRTITAVGPMWDPKEQESNVLEAGIGAQFGVSNGLNLGVEFTAPLAEDIDDGVHERKWGVTVALIGAF
jgi:hypothetical protein